MAKKTFTIPVIRIGYSYMDIDVEATSEGEAERIALAKAGDYEFSEKSAEYDLQRNYKKGGIIGWLNEPI